jgi:hypothetical protein
VAHAMHRCATRGCFALNVVMNVLIDVDLPPPL